MSNGNSTTNENEALIALFQAFMGHLREIKQIEMSWLGLFSLLTILAAGYLSTKDMTETANLLPIMCVWSVAYLLLTLFFQKILWKKRLSYYKTMLVIVRMENHLGFFKKRLLPPGFAYAAFPEGVGPTDEIRRQDNTQRNSSFKFRMIYTFVVLVAILGGACYQVLRYCFNSDTGTKAALVFILFTMLLALIDITFLHRVCRRDRQELRKQAEDARQQGLLGADETLYGT